jgi:hypothetical protein
MSAIWIVVLKMLAFEAMKSWFLDSKNIQVDRAASLRSDVFICKVPPFDPLPGPGRFAEKRETGFHAGVVEETADRDAAPHLDPPILLDEFRDDGL